MIRRDITAPDGMRLATYDAGNPTGPEILFIHGFSQCSLCWRDQFSDPDLARTFRLTAFDIRGHGNSAMPPDPGSYDKDRLYADDIASVLTALNLKKPLIVAWSYAGRLIDDYVMAHGTSAIAAINYVAARTMTDARFNGPGTGHIRGMLKADLATNIAATRKFLRACSFMPHSPAEFELALAYTMAVPPAIRAAHIFRPDSPGDAMDRIGLPVLVTQGTQDLLVSQGLSVVTANRIKGAALSIYPATGHAPFAEATLRFNRELAAFRGANPSK